MIPAAVAAGFYSAHFLPSIVAAGRRMAVGVGGGAEKDGEKKGVGGC